MRIAFLFKGISFIKKYKHWSGKYYSINFKNNVNNVIKCLNLLENKNIYFVTYNNEYIQDLVDILKPINYKILSSYEFNKTQYVLNQILYLINMIDKNSDVNYYVITRFDINLEYNIDLIIDKISEDKIWFLCKAYDTDKTKIFNDDTFIIIPKSLINNFKKVIEELIEEDKLLGHHMIYEKIKNISSFIFDETHTIAVSRPYIKFNREINYNVDSTINFRDIIRYPNLQYTHNNFIIDIIDKYNFKISGSGFVFIRFDNKILLNVRSKNEICINSDLYIKNGNISVYFIKINLNDDIVLFEIKYTDIHFVSFYTEGPPYDKCINMTDVMNKYLFLLKPYIDTYEIWYPRRLKENKETLHLVSEYKIQNPFNPGVHNIGYLKWKPYIILQKLKEVKYGDIVYYRDSNIIKYPVMINGIHETRDLIELVLTEQDIFVPIENYPNLKMKHNVKREIFEEIGKYNDEYLEEFMFNTSIVICKKTDKNIELMESWLKHCMNDRLLTYEIHIRQHPLMHHNVQEQSILNVILKKENIKGRYSLNYRDFSLSKLTIVPKIAVLIVGEMRNFDDFNIIKNNNKFLFEKYNCDIFVSTWTKRGYSFNHGNIINKDNYTDQIREDNIKNIYKRCKKINIEDYDKWFSSLPENYKTIYENGLLNGDILCPATSFPQLYKLYDANRLKCDYENENNFKYDIVIKFRSDMCIINDIDIKIDNNLYHLNPPAIYDNNRIYDIFFMCNTNIMNILSNTYINIIDLINDDFDNGLDKVNACRLLYLYAIKNNINVCDMSFCIGDIYRGENFEEYVNKINKYNDMLNKEEIVETKTLIKKHDRLRKFGRVYIKI